MRILPIIAIDLTKAGEQTIHVAGANQLWIPPKVLLNVGGRPQLVTQVTDAVLGIRFGDVSQEMIAFGIGDSLANSFGGKFDRIFVTVVQGSATLNALLYLNTAQDAIVGYGDADGLSPQVGLSVGGLLTEAAYSHIAGRGQL